MALKQGFKRALSYRGGGGSMQQGEGPREEGGDGTNPRELTRYASSIHWEPQDILEQR